jgi:catalase
MLQGRLFSYGDTHRYRLGANHTELPVNCPHATKAANYTRDGAMRFDGNSGRAKNYEPNSFGGPVQSNQPLWAPIEVHGATGSQAQELHPEDDDFVQAGALYRVMSDAEKERLVANIAAGLAQVSRDDIIERSIGHFRKANSEYGERVAKAVRERRARR